MPTLEPYVLNADLARCQVVRPFAGERRYEAGEIVDARPWKWARHLIERRYLAPLPHDTAPTRKRGQDAE